MGRSQESFGKKDNILEPVIEQDIVTFYEMKGPGGVSAINVKIFTEEIIA
ncbi:MAG TPA: hypothetical protein VJ963_08625 [Bacteroidales bacterium]|nr:hypothetical protein [Bacteroidales bacterium]